MKRGFSFFEFILWLREQNGVSNSIESSEANTPAESKINKSLIPLEVRVCGNPCGCVSLRLQAPHDHIQVLSPMPSSDTHLPSFLGLN